MGESRKKEGFFGPYTEHRDDDGNKVGESREREGFFGPYVEHTDADGNKTGESRAREGFFGPYTEHTDQNHSKAGESRHRDGFFGPYTEHTDGQGNKTGESRHREGFFGPYTEHTGSGNHEYVDKDVEWETQPSRSYSSSSSGEGWWVVPLIGLMLVIGILVALVMFAVFIVIPIAFLNSAVILTILALWRQKQRTLFAAFALVGGAYLLIDSGGGWLSALFVDNVVKDRIWITVFAYLNAVAVGVSAWFLVQPLWKESIALKETDQQRSVLMMVGAISLIAAPVVGLPLIYHLLPVPVAAVDNRAANQQTRTTPAPSGQRPSTSSPANRAAAPTNTNAGQSGSLLTNVNLRACADRTCDSLGEHFKNGRFRILETLDKDGIFWYKIEITQQGCHALNPTWCGKKLLRDRKNQPEVNRSYYLEGDDNASDTGWINSYNKELNVYTVSLD